MGIFLQPVKIEAGLSPNLPSRPREVSGFRRFHTLETPRESSQTAETRQNRKMLGGARYLFFFSLSVCLSISFSTFPSCMKLLPQSHPEIAGGYSTPSGACTSVAAHMCSDYISTCRTASAAWSRYSRRTYDEMPTG